MTQHLLAIDVMAHHDDIRLAAMQQAERHPGVSRVEQRTLAFNHIPMLRGGSGTQDLSRPGLEIRNDRVQGHAAARDQDSRLSRGAKVRGDSPLSERPRRRESGVFLTDRAIRADGQQAFAASLGTGCDRNIFWRRTYVDEPAAEALRGRL